MENEVLENVEVAAENTEVVAENNTENSSLFLTNCSILESWFFVKEITTASPILKNTIYKYFWLSIIFLSIKFGAP